MFRFRRSSIEPENITTEEFQGKAADVCGRFLKRSLIIMSGALELLLRSRRKRRSASGPRKPADLRRTIRVLEPCCSAAHPQGQPKSLRQLPLLPEALFFMARLPRTD